MGYGHPRNDQRSIWLHRAIAYKLLAEPNTVLAKARQHTAWMHHDPHTRAYAHRWDALLALPVDELARRLTENTEEMIALRQCTPFAGVLSPQERWDIYRAFRHSWEVHR